MSDLSSIERLKFEALFDMESGYVLDFSNNTFSTFTIENVGVDIFDKKYEYGSSSKANRLRKFWLNESNEVVGKLLSALLDYWLAKKQIKGEELSSKEKTLLDECQETIYRLSQGSIRQTPKNSSPPQKGRIFISYRRVDSAGYAGRIYDRLVANFGEGAIFMDVDTIEGGVDFVKVLEDAVQSCDVLIALIGRQWLGIKDKDGKRRLDNPEDFVRIEIATALKRDIRVIPVLVDGVDMPRPTDLPDNLKALARRNALQVNHHSFNSDVHRLIEHAKSALDEAEVSRVMREKTLQAAREKAEKEAAEKSRLEAEEKARQKTIKEKIEEPKREKWYSGWTYSIGIIVFLIIAIYLISPLIGQWLSPPSAPTEVAISTITLSTPLTPPPPTLSVTVPVTPNTPTPTLTHTVEMLEIVCVYPIHAEDESLLTIGDKFGVDYRLIEYYYGAPNFFVGELVKIPNVKQDTCIDKDGLPEEMNDFMGVEMVLVLAGDFVMGNEDDPQYKIPERTVSLETFYIDIYEVTNALYKACADAGNCTPPTDNGSETRTDYYENPEFDNYPVVYVNWDMAIDYCEWRGTRLPTNEEWEKAARDTDGRTFPWGDDIDESHANYNSTDTVAVGRYEIGRSPMGAYDMAGNVSEWVSSSGSPYLFNPDDNIRGGSWFDGQEVFLRSYFPGFATTQYETNNRFGFRCAINDPQPFSQLSE